MGGPRIAGSNAWRMVSILFRKATMKKAIIFAIGFALLFLGIAEYINIIRIQELISTGSENIGALLATLGLSFVLVGINYER